MTTKILIKRVEELEKQVKALQFSQPTKAGLPGEKITDAMLNKLKKSWSFSGHKKSNTNWKDVDLTLADFQEAKKLWSKPPKFITKKDVEQWKP
jgi:hypothetical protein